MYVRTLTHIIEKLPIADTIGDSASVEIPISQSVYRGDSYTAYVSGYRQKLDSISIVRPISTVITPPQPKRTHFAVGLSAGYAATPAGLQPYIGVGITLKLWEF